MSRRMSFGGRAAPLGDASSYHNARSASSSYRSETPGKDRRVLLDEWRQFRVREQLDTSQSDISYAESAMKRPRHQDAPRPPTSRSSAHPTTQFAAEGTTALERFRMRKQMTVQQQQPQQQQYPPTLMNDESFNANGLCLDISDELPSSYSARSRRTTMLTSGARRKTIMPMSSTSRKPPFSQESSESVQVPSQVGVLYANHGGNLMSQLTQDSESILHKSNEQVDVVEGAGLRSQLREMKLRIEQLEREKIDLSMAKAPLEARFRQKEDEWMKESGRMMQEIDSLKYDSLEANERYRDLLLKYEATEEEVKRLRFQVRKASSSLNANGSTIGNPWSRHAEHEVDELQEKLCAALEELDSMRLEKVSVEKELHATKIELESLARSYDELQDEYETIARSTSDNRDAEIQLEVLTTEHIATAAQLNAVCSDLAATKARAEAALHAKEERYKKEMEQLHFDMTVLKTRAGKFNQSLDNEESSSIEDDAVLKARIEERDRRIADLEQELFRGEALRRQMHNRIQELRGNIRVFVRTRPFLPSDGQETDPAIDVSPDGESLNIVDKRNDAKHDFKFDKVFPPSAGQDSIFQDVADFVQSALDGYQVCLFSYGQTGSGKTHTMQGSGTAAMRGIIPRAVEQILDQAKVMRKQKWDFRLCASFLEIYNENLNDLLLTMSGNRDAIKNPPKLAIKRTREGNSFVDGLTEVTIDVVDTNKGIRQLEDLMSVAARARSVASTKMNAQSSRSHSVFMLHIRGSNEDTGAEVQGSLNLCDLAGSERLDRSGASSDAIRLRETQSINKSLSCLGDVFNALGQKASHVPYRNSKLTYLLQDCLSGDGKALMFVNLSPTIESSNESVCSLRFAQRVNQVELGKPTKNIQYKR